MKKTKKKYDKHGNNVQIDYDVLYPDNMVMTNTLTLTVVSGCDGKSDTIWRGEWANEEISIHFSIQTSAVTLSNNFPTKFANKAYKEVERITRQFN